MCIGLWSLEHPDYALILCTNRDEYLNRPTQQARFHSFSSSLEDDSLGTVLSGRDVQAGGSWFGINTAGRVALLTNITEIPSPDGYTTSRGSLVSSFLLSRVAHPLQEEFGTIVPQHSIYAGFNLLLLDPVLIQSTTRIGGLPSTSEQAIGPGATVAVSADAGAPEKSTLNLPGSSDSPSLQYDSAFVTNHGGGKPLSSRSLSHYEKCCGCMSNGIDGEDTDRWPKISRASTDFEAVLQSISNSQTTEATLVEQLFGVLGWHSGQVIKSKDDIRKTVQVLPTPFDGHYYGTRLSTVLLVHKDGRVLFIERDIWELGPDREPFKADPPKQREFRFEINFE